MKSSKLSAAFLAVGGVGVGVGVGVIVGVGVPPPPTTVVVVVAVLFPETGSTVNAETDTLPVMIVPFDVPALTLTVNVKTVAPVINVGAVQTMLPVPPTAGVVQLNPNLAADDNETKVVLAGIGIVRTTLVAKLGPLLVKKIE